jgi:hypothetical protein
MAVCSYTLLDVVKRVAFGVGNFAAAVDSVENPDPKTFNMVECVNRVIRKIAQVKGLPMLNAEHTLTTLAPYDTGTVALAQGSVTVTGTTTAWTSDMQDWAFTIKAYNALFRVSSVTAAGSLTLSEPWPFISSTAQTYILAQDRYEMPADFSDFVSVSMQGDVSRPLSIRTPTEIDLQRHRMRTNVIETGAPNMITVFDKNTTGNWLCELDPFPDDVYQISFRYKGVASRIVHDNDVVPVADEHIDLLFDGVTALWKQQTGVDGAQQAFLAWIAQDLTMHASFDRKSTDETLQISPADVTGRRSVTGQGGADAYPFSFSR